MLHLKGAVINELNKRPWQQLDNTEEIKKKIHTNIMWEPGDFLFAGESKKKKEQKCKTTIIYFLCFLASRDSESQAEEDVKEREWIKQCVR